MSHDRRPRGAQFLGQGGDAIVEAIDRRRLGPAPVAERDWCDTAGALELARRIERYWRQLGSPVAVRTEPCSFRGTGMVAAQLAGDLHGIKVVRSDLVNGLPRREGAR